MTITFGSVCTGIGAPEVAWLPLGWTPQWFAEIEQHPSTILAHHYPLVPNMGDMTKLPGYVRMGLLPAPDVLVGGTPCQAYSLAGLRLGLEDERGQLTLKFVELADAIDDRRAPGDECIVVWENVPGVLSDSTNAFGHFLAGLAGEDEPLVVSGGKWSNAGLVVGPRRAIAWRIVDAQYFGVAQRRRRVLVVASARNGFDPGAVLFEFDGLRRDSAPRREAGQEAAVGTIRSTDGGCDVDHARAGRVLPVADVLVYAPEISAALETTSHDYSRADGFTALAFHVDAQPDQMRFDPHVSASLTCSQKAGALPQLQHHWRVRRLTPRECERLQGFPDDYTRVPLPDRRASTTTDRRELPRMMADGPRYKALGNSMCVHKMRWLGLRIMFNR